MRPGYTEDWFPVASESKLAELVAGVAHLDGLLVEIGSWEGRSTVALANAAFPRVVDAVDTWAGSPGEISAELAAERDVFAQWRANIDAFTQGNVRAHRMGWRDFLPTVTERVAFAFIDAEHSFTEVHDNLAALLPMMVPGGVICGDDVHHPPVQQAVSSLLDPNLVDTFASLWIWKVPA